MNRTEQITYNLCRQSFLSLWSLATPLRRNGKEFCDVLVVFDQDIIIFSIKEILHDDSNRGSVSSERWKRKAIDDSVRQIYNAQRWINQNEPILTSDRKPIPIPLPTSPRIFRIAVALGSGGKVQLRSQDFGKGFIHVHNEVSIEALVKELDTITDFVGFLKAVEFLSSQTVVKIAGGDENLLAIYLQNGRSFPIETGPALAVFGNEWEDFKRKPEVIARKELDKISYLWDMIIEDFSRFVSKGALEYESNPGHAELALRIMAKENRFNRRILGQHIDEILQTTPVTHRKARMIQSPSGIVYVLCLSERQRDRADRRMELEHRCYVARDMVPGSRTVIGIATENYDPTEKGRSFDTCYIDFEQWTDEHRKMAEEIQSKLGFFAETDRKQFRVEEYPTDVKFPEREDDVTLDVRAAKLASLRERFPTTLEYLIKSEEFDTIARQLTIEGCKDWEILQAGCNIVAKYRIDREGTAEPSVLLERLKEYINSYTETAYSPMPPSGQFLLKMARRQIQADRLARLARENRVSIRQGVPVNDSEDVQPQNCFYAKTKDGFDLWRVFLPLSKRETTSGSPSEHWTIALGSKSTEPLLSSFCKDLSSDIARYAVMVDWWLGMVNTGSRRDTNIVVYGEKSFKELFPDSYSKVLGGQLQMNGSPIVFSGRDNEGRPHLKLVVNQEICRQSRMQRLAYGAYGLLECICGIRGSEAAKQAAEFVTTLE